MFFNFLKKNPVKFEKGEEIEISIKRGTASEVFITRIIDFSSKEMFLEFSPSILKQDIIQPEEGILVYISREGMIGKFNTKTRQIMKNEIPPFFSLDMPKHIAWGKIVPGLFALKNLKDTSKNIRIRVSQKNAVFETTLMRIGTDVFSFPGVISLIPSEPVSVSFLLPQRSLTIDTSIVKSYSMNEKDYKEIVVEFSNMPKNEREYLFNQLL